MNTFKEIVGNEYIIKNLQNSILNDRLSHVYIINGLEGSGRKVLAKTLAKTLQCEKGGKDACCNCMSCYTFDSGNHPDIIYIKSSKIKSIGIDDIRQQVIDIVGIKPYKYKYKIFIIDNADKMTIQSQNAILKTIEEPPLYAIFILLSTNFNSFLPTILSRCILLKINALSQHIIKKYLIDNLNTSLDEALIYSAFSQGSIGKAKEMASSDEFIKKRDTIISMATQIKNKDIIELFDIVKELEIYKDDISSIFDILLTWYRDILLLKNPDNERHIIQKDKIDTIKKESLISSYDNILNSINIIENTRYQLSQNANFQLSLELMFLKIKELENENIIF